MTVDDSAPGVPAQQLGQVFEPLFRGDLARNRRLGGSGLGLAICQAIAQAHGGHVAASASELGGLRITVELPALALASPVPEGGRT
jgi:two-component system sensor histidine kinase BaeS